MALPVEAFGDEAQHWISILVWRAGIRDGEESALELKSALRKERTRMRFEVAEDGLAEAEPSRPSKSEPQARRPDGGPPDPSAPRCRWNL